MKQLELEKSVKMCVGHTANFVGRVKAEKHAVSLERAHMATLSSFFNFNGSFYLLVKKPEARFFYTQRVK